MKAFARWIKASSQNQDTEEYYFRKNTILQFGNSWNVIGAAILINPGSAMPTEELIDSATKSKLREVSNTYNENGEWRVFNVDSTMRFLEKIFSGWYIGQRKELEGVILLYNLFNIRCKDLNKALELRADHRFKDMEDMVTKSTELTTMDVPFYIGWGNTGKYHLRADAEELFKQLKGKVCYYTGEDFMKAPCYHPLYVNTSYHTDATKNVLCRFLRCESDVRPLLKINKAVGDKVFENIKTRIGSDGIVESNSSKLSFTVCDDKLTVAIVSQKTKQYIYWQHSKYNKSRNYRDFNSDYLYVTAIRSILEAYGYNVNLDSSLGEKNLKDFASINIEEISNLILSEFHELSQKICRLFSETPD